MNEYAKKWVEALRSGEFKQGKYQLKTFDEEGNTRYCCLGVAEEVIDEVKRYCDNSLAYDSLELLEIDTEIEGKLISDASKIAYCTFPSSKSNFRN